MTFRRQRVQKPARFRNFLFKNVLVKQLCLCHSVFDLFERCLLELLFFVQVVVEKGNTELNAPQLIGAQRMPL